MLWGTTDKKQKKKVATALFKLGELYDKHAKAAKKRDRLAGKVFRFSPLIGFN